MPDGREHVTVLRHAVPLTGTTSGPLTRPQAVLWDMDGTLVDSEKLWDISLAELARELGGELRPAVRAAMVGSNMGRTLELMFTALERRVDPAELEYAEQWLNDRTRELFITALPWRPGAQAALRAVHEAGIRTALVTSTHRELTEVALRSIGVEYFDVTVCGDEVTRTKPHPEPYLRAAAQLGVDPTACVAVEDSPTGTAAAVAAGCTVLVVPCEVPVDPGERRVLRESLVGVDVELLAALLPAVGVGPIVDLPGTRCEDGTP